MAIRDLQSTLEASERRVAELRAALTDVHIQVTDAVRIALARQEPTP